jgi:Tol biopolymer transport system component
VFLWSILCRFCSGRTDANRKCLFCKDSEGKNLPYDLYWMNIETGKTTRLTFAPGADVLPVFSPDYTKVMWTSNRDGQSPSQLYIADFTPPKE